MVAIGREDLENAVRFVLDHLYDPPALRGHPLMGMLVPHEDMALASRLQMLRRIMLEAIERLDPGPNVALGSRLRRPYQVLRARYIEDLSVEEIAREMGLSERQVRREQASAISLLAERLQTCLLNAEPAPDAGRPPEPACEITEAVSRLGLQREPVPVADVLADVLSLLEPLRDQLGVDVEVQLAEPGAIVLGDRVLLRQVLLTLISALVQEAQASPVQVHLQAEAEQAILRLACRADASRVTSRLAPSRELALALNGSLHLEPTVGGGSQVSLALPGAQQCRVLVIDDDPAMAALLGRYAAGYGYTILAETDSSKALARAQAWQPNLIILDVMMHSPDGWQLLRLLKQHAATRHVPIIICSVLPDPALALALGVAQYLKKPVHQADLLHVLEKCRKA
jgi:CheY-like chemotaxis protein